MIIGSLKDSKWVQYDNAMTIGCIVYVITTTLQLKLSGVAGPASWAFRNTVKGCSFPHESLCAAAL